MVRFKLPISDYTFEFISNSMYTEISIYKDYTALQLNLYKGGIINYYGPHLIVKSKGSLWEWFLNYTIEQSYNTAIRVYDSMDPKRWLSIFISQNNVDITRYAYLSSVKYIVYQKS